MNKAIFILFFIALIKKKVFFAKENTINTLNIMQNSKPNILLVDDSQINNLLLESAFEDLDVNTSVAYSGKSALKMIKKQQFDLLILDIMMPKMTGLELVNAIKEKQPDFNTPIVFVTASDYSKESLQKENSDLTIDFFAKPINLDAIRTKVKSLLNLK